MFWKVAAVLSALPLLVHVIIVGRAFIEWKPPYPPSGPPA